MASSSISLLLIIFSYSRKRSIERNRIERLINRLKQFRRVATRYKKRAENYLVMLRIAAIIIWLK